MHKGNMSLPIVELGKPKVPVNFFWFFFSFWNNIRIRFLSIDFESMCYFDVVHGVFFQFSILEFEISNDFFVVESQFFVFTFVI